MKKARLLAAILCLICLTACGTRTQQIVKQDYIKPVIPALPAEPSYYPVVWTACAGGLYCLDARNAKNELKNAELLKAYASDLRLILEGLKKDR